jgi:polyisoprenoid-binding protein YceI
VLRYLTVGALATVLLLGVASALVFSSTAPRGETARGATTPNDVSATGASLAAEVAGAQARVFTISPGTAQARFVVDEVLRGSPNTVTGVTDQVSGQITVDPAQPGGAELGPIQVNARSLATDDNLRNNAIRRFILETDEHEWITFAPTGVVGLPASAEPGQTYTLQVPGQLTIRNVTRDVVFDATVTPVSESELRGSASTTIRRGDFSIGIPQIPFVADVGENVRLELDFTAAG